jgi:hypothetical protein
MRRESKLLLTAMIVLQLTLACDIRSKPSAGAWEGEGISFTICGTQDTITQLNVVIPYDGEYLAQMYYSLDIVDGKFSSLRDGNSYLGIPEANLTGEFISMKLAKGTFNGVNWIAVPAKKKEE